VTGRIQQGSTRLNKKGERVPAEGGLARSWRQVAALYTMRGCYDTTDSEMVVQNYKSGDSYRYQGNPYLMDGLNSYIDTGEGFRASGRSMSIGGYTSSFNTSKTSGRTYLKCTAPVHKEGNLIPFKEGIEYTSTELMNKLLEVQQLMFTNLIKE